jgi:outer membrane protein insertion porin family
VLIVLLVSAAAMTPGPGSAPGEWQAWAVDKLPVAEPDENWLRRKPEIEKLIITGNEHLSEREIRGQMEMVPRSMLGGLGLRKRPRILRDAWQRDRQALVELYQRHGFLQARVIITIRRIEHNERAIIEVFVDEGRRTVWGTIAVSADSSVAAGKIHRWLRQLHLGEPANPVLLRQTLLQCQSTYADYGLPYAQFATRWDIDSTSWDTAHLAIEVQPGPVVHFGKVEISGNSRTRTNIIRRELAFAPGTLYSRKLINESQNNIYRTGMFTFTRLLVQTDSTSFDTLPNLAPDFIVKVVERKPSYIDFSTGAGQDVQQDLTWDYSVEWGTRNWLGTGRRWALQAKSEFRAVAGQLINWTILYHRFVARYTEPWIFGVRLPTTAQVSYEPRVRSAIHQYWLTKIAGELSFTISSGLTRKAWFSLIHEDVKFDIDSLNSRQLRQDEGVLITRKLTLTLEKDSRPNILVPTSGSLTRLETEWAGGFLGGDAGFYKVVGSWARYQMYAASVFATRFKIGYVNELSHEHPVPTIDRFYSGGANSIRGYQENRVGPSADDGSPSGGRIFGITNIEMRTPVIWKLWFTVFGDMGNNWDKPKDMKLTHILLTLGVGVQYTSPVGPLRLDYGRRVIHHGHPASDRMHLSILFSF